jgi:ankyrin repeat protein
MAEGGTERPGEGGDPAAALVAAISANDVAVVRQLLEGHPGLRQRLNDPLAGLSFGATALLGALPSGNREMIDVLLRAGADINQRSHWWAGGFGVLDHDGELAPFLIDRGAVVDVHAAARLGMRDRLEALLEADPSRVGARGGDGQTPLHVAATVEIADLLLDRGADIDAVDVDHESTAAQYLVRRHPEVARRLVERGCRTDILLAAALGDLALVRRHLDADPACIYMNVSAEFFPMRDPRAGGTICIWTLGARKTPWLVAREFGHEDVLALLRERSPAELHLAQACELGDETAVRELLARSPDGARGLTAAARRRVADAAESNDGRAVRLMLDAGWPVDVRGSSGATPLHFAAWHGNVDMARAILARRPPLELRDEEYDATPLGWAFHGSRFGWNRAAGDHAGVVQLLLDAGAVVPPAAVAADATEPVRAVLERHRAKG